ncbi:hypothetical protein LOAG_10053 [Loa loa]|uniref:Uncharacterized protein n=1 Tax=Loa loa TaxID=7209 RepID=A0A1S0TQH6_LOALO|nr:hypothetical protein LOAG_10053 [Loa loa]EFO18442.1 hypothetical protein LOAG_10053 [Loa loa]
MAKMRKPSLHRKILTISEQREPSRKVLTFSLINRILHCRLPSAFLVYGLEPDYIREGGSIPVIIVFQEMTRSSVVLLPIGSSDDIAHSQNGKLFRILQRRINLPTTCLGESGKTVHCAFEGSKKENTYVPTGPVKSPKWCVYFLKLASRKRKCIDREEGARQKHW